MGVLALLLGVLTVTGVVQLWHVYVFAFLFGCAAAFDAPVRQTFVSQLVGEEDLHNAVTLNTMSFNIGSLIGPAASGLMIAAVGTGWAFLLNGASFLAVVASLFLLRAGELHASAPARRRPGSFAEGLRYVAGRPDLIAILRDAVPTVRHLRVQLPDLHLDHGGARVPCRRPRLWRAVVAVGGGDGGRRLAERAERASDADHAPLERRPARRRLHLGRAWRFRRYWSFAAALVVVGVACMTASSTPRTR